MAAFTVSELTCMGDLCMLFVSVYTESLEVLVAEFFFSTENFYNLCTYFPVLFKVLIQFYCFSYFLSGTNKIVARNLDT